MGIHRARAETQISQDHPGLDRKARVVASSWGTPCDSRISPVAGQDHGTIIKSCWVARLPRLVLSRSLRQDSILSREELTPNLHAACGEHHGPGHTIRLCCRLALQRPCRLEQTALGAPQAPGPRGQSWQQTQVLVTNPPYSADHKVRA